MSTTALRDYVGFPVYDVSQFTNANGVECTFEGLVWHLANQHEYFILREGGKSFLIGPDNVEAAATDGITAGEEILSTDPQ